jgi:exosortase/archaeosortase family protein
MTMVTLALVLGAVGEISTPKRWVLVLFAVPAAIAANMLRLVVTGFGAYVVSSSFADGFLHGLSGMVVFVTGLGVLLSVYAILRRMP